MQPLLLWQTGFWAAMYSCCSSGMRRDFANMGKPLALCLVLLALLPANARRGQRVRIKALAREADRAAAHLAEERNPHSFFFKAWPTRTAPPQLPEQAQETLESHSGQAQMQGSSPKMAVLQSPTSHPQSARGRTEAPRSPPTSCGQTGPAFPAAFKNSGSEDLGPRSPIQLASPDLEAHVAAQEGGHEPGDEPQGPPSSAERETCSRRGGAALHPYLLEGRMSGAHSDQDMSGSDSDTDQDMSGSDSDTGQDSSGTSWAPSSSGDSSSSSSLSPSSEAVSMDEPRVPPLSGAPSGEVSGEGQAATPHQGRPTLQQKRKAGQGGGDALAGKVARHSEGQRVCSLTSCHTCMCASTGKGIAVQSTLDLSV